MRDPVTLEVVVGQLNNIDASGELAAWVIREHRRNITASFEIERLRKVIHEHVSALMAVPKEYNAHVHTDEDIVHFEQFMTVRLEPMTYQISMPLRSGVWAVDHIEAFIKDASRIFAARIAGMIGWGDPIVVEREYNVKD